MTRRWLVVGCRHALVLGLAALLGCESRSGSFAVTFGWEGGAAPSFASTPYLFGRVHVDHAGGRLLGTADPIPLRPGERLSFPPIPNGSARVVVMELRAGPEDEAQVLYYGISAPFDLVAGVDTIVEVAVPLRAVPNALGFEAGVGVAVQSDSGPGYARTREVTLALLVDRAERVRVSNFVGFPEGDTSEAVLTDLTAWSAERGLARLLPWDLDAGLSAACAGRNFCPRQVYVRFIDEHGYSSSTLVADVTLDEAAPALLSASITPPEASPITPVQVSLTFTEPLLAAPVLRLGDATSFVLEQRFPGPADDQSASTYVFALSALGASGSHPLLVDATDRAGNAATGLPAGPVFVDGEPPVIASPRVLVPAGGRVGLADRSTGLVLELAFDLNEAPAPGFPRVRIGPHTATCTGGVPTYSCTYTLDGAETQGVKLVTISTSDGAGNGRENTDLSFDFDFEAPSVVLGSIGLTLVSGEDNPLALVTRVTAGTTALVSFVVSELLSTDPTVRAVEAGIDLTLAGRSGSNYRYQLLLPVGAVPQGSTTVEVTLQDLVANMTRTAIDLPEPGIVIDTSPPLVPSLDGLTYERRPWGAQDSGGEPESWLAGNLAACPSGDCPYGLVFDREAIDTALELGRDRVMPDGSLRVDLGRTDRDRVYLALADAAGNLSDASGTAGLQGAVLREVRWRASLGGKVAGSLRENLHGFATRSWFTASLISASASELAEPALARMGDGGARTQGAGTWRARGRLEADNPGPSFGHAMVHDWSRGELQLFQGDEGAYHDELWSRRDGRWLVQSPLDPEADGEPAARRYHALAFDSARGRTVLFGGLVGAACGTVSGYCDDTWEWDGSTWRRVTPLDPEGDGNPVARSRHAMTYDAHRGRVVLFGGCTATSCANLANDTWEWDGLSWLRVSVAAAPRARYWHALHYEPVSARVLLVGGDSGSDCGEGTPYCGDTWAWDGTAWTQLADDAELARSSHALASDASSLWLFGGFAGSYLGDTWWWDGTDFLPVVVTDSGDGEPTPRRWHAMALEPLAGRLTLWAGWDGAPNEETWEWDGAEWHPVASGDPEGDANPAAREGAAAVWDAARAEIVLFGGGFFATTNAETWVWTGASWTRRTPGNAPAARTWHAMAADTARATVVLFGGYDAGLVNDETWSWDGADWTAVSPAESPPARARHVMTYDATAQQVVLFGGSTASGGDCGAGSAYCGDTWLWDGGSWAPGALGPSPREDAAMAYDPVRQRVLLFGGFNGTVLGDTWQWDGTVWSPLEPTGDRPAARYGARLAYDAEREKLVLFGGADVGLFGDLWEWDGSTWLAAAVADPESDGAPTPRRRPAMAYDHVRGEMVVWGGFDLAHRDDTWTWNGGAAARPGHTFTASFAAAGGPDPLGCLGVSACAVRSVAVTWVSGASGGGVTLSAWDGARWRMLQTGAGSPESPALLQWESADPALVPWLFHGDERALNIAVAPVDESGAASPHGVVVTDYVEVEVSYRAD